MDARAPALREVTRPPSARCVFRCIVPPTLAKFAGCPTFARAASISAESPLQSTGARVPYAKTVAASNIGLALICFTTASLVIKQSPFPLYQASNSASPPRSSSTTCRCVVPSNRSIFSSRRKAPCPLDSEIGREFSALPVSSKPAYEDRYSSWPSHQYHRCSAVLLQATAAPHPTRERPFSRLNVSCSQDPWCLSTLSATVPRAASKPGAWPTAGSGKAGQGNVWPPTAGITTEIIDVCYWPANTPQETGIGSNDCRL